MAEPACTLDIQLQLTRGSFRLHTDVRLPGRNSLELARVAADMQTGGVGLYRRDGFIHLDCGPARRW